MHVQTLYTIRGYEATAIGESDQKRRGKRATHGSIVFPMHSQEQIYASEDARNTHPTGDVRRPKRAVSFNNIFDLFICKRKLNSSEIASKVRDVDVAMLKRGGARQDTNKVGFELDCIWECSFAAFFL